ncbi:hypothetical protein [Mycobacterium sp.]|uniref:hypothetical protein n=1 Tax=Mycobacterium sp. TaxID=1785 RepID=UPI002D9DE386|nr:hypothetical protein [Mycobacterium sp.]
MTESRARRDLDFDYLLDDPDGNDGWFGQALPADTTVLHQVDELELDDSQETREDDSDPDTDRWYVPPPVQPAEPAPPAAGAVISPAPDDLRRDDALGDGWNDPRESRFDALYAPRNGSNGSPRIGEWSFTVSRPEPWYRNKNVKTGLIAVAVAAVAVPLVLLAVRSFAAGDEDATTVPSQAPTSAQPAPTSAAPALSTARPAPPAPPPPPPPPPPPADADPAPVITREYQPRQSSPEQSDKPEIGVTRTPVTRAPISAKPPPPPPPGRNSSTPGDSPGGGWGW